MSSDSSPLTGLPDHERTRRWQGIRQAMERDELECLIVWGSSGSFRQCMANLKYVSNVTTDGYIVFPADGDATLFSFLEGHEPGSWITDLRTGHPKYSLAIADRIRELRLQRSRIGLVGLSGFYGGDVGFPHTTYASLAEALPGADLQDATPLVEDIRKIKSPAEVMCLERGCEVSDLVIRRIEEVAAPGVQDRDVVAVIMDTLYRGGCEPGSMILYCSGRELIHAGEGGNYSSASQRMLASGDAILLEWDAKYLGYLAQYNQPFAVGKPSAKWQETFAVAAESFSNGLRALRPGVSVADLNEAFDGPVREAGFTYRNPHFHGLGLAVEKPIGPFPGQPLFQADLAAPIEAGMVIECQPHVVRSDARIGLHIGVPVLVTETGCRVLSRTSAPTFPVLE